MNLTRNMRVNQKIKRRVLDTAQYMLRTRATVRDAAKRFNVSKSTVHKDVTDRLEIINPELYVQVKKLLDYHFQIKHIRGGQAIKNKNMRKNG